MKHHPLLALILLGASSVGVGHAQEKLAVGKFFSGDFTSRDGVTAVTVSGKKLNPLNLSIYRSVSVPSNSASTPQIERAVKTDGRTASSREVSYRDGHLYFGFYTLPPSGDEMRYLFYLNSDVAPKKIPCTAPPRATLIYMEGKASPEEIRSMLKKN